MVCFFVAVTKLELHQATPRLLADPFQKMASGRQTGYTHNPISGESFLFCWQSHNIQRVAKVVPRLVRIVENSFGALDFEKSCLFVKRIGNAWFSGFHDRIYDFQLVFSMLGKDFTSELLKTWSLHLVGVLMLGKDFTSDLLKTWSLHLVGVLMLGKDFTSDLLKTWSLHLVGVLMLGKDFTSDLLKTWSLHLVGVLMLGKDFTSELLKTWSLHLVGVLMLDKDFTSELLKTWSLHLVGVLMLGKDFTSELLKTWSLHLVGVLSSHFFLCINVTY